MQQDFDSDDDGDGGFFDRALEQHDRSRVTEARPAVVVGMRWWRALRRSTPGRQG